MIKRISWISWLYISIAAITIITLAYFGVVHILDYYLIKALQIVIPVISALVIHRIIILFLNIRKKRQILEHTATLYYTFFKHFTDNPLGIKGYMNIQTYIQESVISFRGTVPIVKTRFLMKSNDLEDVYEKCESLREWLLSASANYGKENRLKGKKNFPRFYPAKAEVIDTGAYIQMVIVDSMESVRYIQGINDPVEVCVDVDTTNKDY